MITIQKIIDSYNSVRTKRIRKENFQLFLASNFLQDFYLNPEKMIDVSSFTVSVHNGAKLPKGRFLLIGAIHPGTEYLTSVVDTEISPLIALVREEDFSKNTSLQNIVLEFQKNKNLMRSQEKINDLVSSDSNIEGDILQVSCCLVHDCFIESNLKPLTIHD